MKSFLTGIAISAPLTALAFMLFLSGKHDVQVTQERSEVTQRLDETRFDQDFDKITAGITGKKSSNIKKLQAKKRKDKITELEKKQAEFDKQMADELLQTSADESEMRQALIDLPPPPPLK